MRCPVNARQQKHLLQQPSCSLLLWAKMSPCVEGQDNEFHLESRAVTCFPLQEKGMPFDDETSGCQPCVLGKARPARVYFLEGDVPAARDPRSQAFIGGWSSQPLGRSELVGVAPVFDPPRLNLRSLVYSWKTTALSQCDGFHHTACGSKV